MISTGRLLTNRSFSAGLDIPPPKLYTERSMAQDNVTNGEIMSFLQEHMVMRADLENFMTKDDGRRLEHRMFSLEDQMAQLREKVDLELIAPTRRMDRIEHRVTVVEGKLGLA